MKFCYILLNEVFEFVKRHIRIVIIIIIGMTVSAAALIFSFQTAMYISSEIFDNPPIESRSLSIFLYDSDNDILQDKLGECILNVKNIKEVDLVNEYTILNVNGNDYELIGAPHIYEPYRVIKGRDFSENENKYGSEVILIPVWLDDGQIKSIKILNDDYEIVGYTNYYNKYIIPYSTYINKHFSTKKIEIIFNKIPSKILLNQVVSIFKKSNIELKAENPKDIILDIINENLFIIAFSALIMVFSVINIISLFSYWIIGNIHTLYVYNICGAKKAIINQIIFCQVFIFLLISYIFTWVGYISFEGFIRKIEFYYHLKFYYFLAIFILNYLALAIGVKYIVNKNLKRQLFF